MRTHERPEEEFCSHQFWVGMGCPVCNEESQGAPATRQVGGSHYKDMKIQPWDIYDTWPKEQQIGAYRALALKYVMRMGNKEGVGLLEEAEKGLHTLQKLVEVLRDEDISL